MNYLSRLHGSTRSAIAVQRLDLDSDEPARRVGRTEKERIARPDDALHQAPAHDAAYREDRKEEKVFISVNHDIVVRVVLGLVVVVVVVFSCS